MGFTTATTGPVLWPGASTFPGSSVYPGQGIAPIVRCRLAFDAAGNSSPVRVVGNPPNWANPNWVELGPTKLRTFTVARGRDQGYGDINAGACTVILDNRNRDFDPTFTGSPYYNNVRPMNRIWLYEEFSGEVRDVFKGWVTSYNQSWPGGGWSDAQVEVNAVDEFLVLSLEQLATTNPPADSYTNLVAFDQPDGYWGLGDDPATLQQATVDLPPSEEDHFAVIYTAQPAGRPSWWRWGRRHWPH